MNQSVARKVMGLGRGLYAVTDNDGSISYEPTAETIRRADEMGRYYRAYPDRLVMLLCSGGFPERTRGSCSINRFNHPGKKHGVDEILEKLESVNYARHIDAGIMQATAAYARSVVDGVDTRFTDGDLQPGDLLVDTNSNITIVDCEACSWLWPRHYNIVNLIFNYGSSKDWLRPKFAGFFDDYCQKAAVGTGQATIDTCNLSAAMRCLQIVYENLGDVLDKKPKDAQLDPRLKNYVEATAQRILNGQLFFE